MQMQCYISVHYCVKKFRDDHEEYWYFKQVFDGADNFECINCAELGGGTNNNGVTELTYRSAGGNVIKIKIDGGFPVPELATFDICADFPTNEFVSELVSAFSQYHGKCFYHELSEESNFFRIDLYPDMTNTQSQDFTYWDKLRMLVEIAKKYDAMPLEDCIRLSLLESGLYTPAVKRLCIGEKAHRMPNLFGCYRENGDYYIWFTNERADMMTKKMEDIGSFMIAICRELPTL